MLHIATVHFNSPRWIPIQARQLDRHIGVPYRTWASLEGIDDSYGSHFDCIIPQRGSHAGKLNHLALEIGLEAGPDDLLLFLDGDAFPIADPWPLISSALATAPLLAVQRIENAGDLQPHPCFCVTRVATWRELCGDWGSGYSWSEPGSAPRSDVGANLLRRLEVSGTPWAPVPRTNRRNPHPVFFGVYGDAIYHHGAGFRDPLSRADMPAVGPPVLRTSFAGCVERRLRRARQRRLARRNGRMSEALLRRIESDDPGWLSELV